MAQSNVEAALEVAQKNLKVFEKECSALFDKRDRERSQAITELENQLKTKYGDSIARAKVSVSSALKLVQELSVEVERLNTDSIPEGTKVVQWKLLGYPRRGEWALSGLVGLVEVYSAESAPVRSKWRKPYHGQRIVRQLKKDGTPSQIIYEGGRNYTNGLPFGWYLQGISPADAE